MKVDVSYKFYNDDIDYIVLTSEDKFGNISKFHMSISDEDEKILTLAHVDISTGKPNENKLEMNIGDARQFLLIIAQFLQQLQPNKFEYED